MPITVLSSAFPWSPALENAFHEILGESRFEPGASEWEVQTLPLCSAVPTSLKIMAWIRTCSDVEDEPDACHDATDQDQELDPE